MDAIALYNRRCAAAGAPHVYPLHAKGGHVGPVSPESAMLRKLSLYLIKPSKYDDDGYVIRHWLGIVPSNTLSTLYGLTDDVRRRRALGAVEIETHVFDETVQRIPVERICRVPRRPDVKVAALLVGVQTNQFPRAADLARPFRRAGGEVGIAALHPT